MFGSMRHAQERCAQNYWLLIIAAIVALLWVSREGMCWFWRTSALQTSLRRVEGKVDTLLLRQNE